MVGQLETLAISTIAIRAHFHALHTIPLEHELAEESCSFRHHLPSHSASSKSSNVRRCTLWVFRTRCLSGNRHSFAPHVSASGGCPVRA